MFMQSIVLELSKCDVVLVDINECSNNGCMNGATCTDAVNAYMCACVAGYTGPHCETGNSSQFIISIQFNSIWDCQMYTCII